jgi:MFS superfamily sulfate permease-like transporter
MKALNFNITKDQLYKDLYSGFIVFLIALPLCLGISMASGFPPIAGILTAIIGGLVSTWFTNSQLTIKGPAAGLIAISVAAVQELGAGGSAMQGYHLALACIVVAGVFQILFGMLKSGVLGDFFPSAAVHGMLAAIGIIIISKQVHVLLGVKPDSKEVLDLITEIPNSLAKLNPEILVIGLVSLIILFGLPTIKVAWVKKLPAPLIVVLVAIGLGFAFDLEHTHKYLFLHHTYNLDDKFLVTLPSNLADSFQFPNFGGFADKTGPMIKYTIMYALVGSLESLLTCKAIDIMDPKKRKTNLNKDLTAVGIGNTMAGMLGGLPMISEVVRSSANVNNNAQSKLSNFFHGIFLLLFVVFLPNLLHQIPLAALAAILIYTGFRLASPKEFYKTYKVGKAQFVIFMATIIGTLATDLLVGIAIGILVKFLFHIYFGLSMKEAFKPILDLSNPTPNTYNIDVKSSAVFSNLISLKKQLALLPAGKKITINFSQSKIVDHTMLEALHLIQNDYNEQGGEFAIIGLDEHKTLGSHPQSTKVISY